MRKDRLYIAFLVVSVIAFVVAEALKPEEVNFTPDYTRSRTLPLSTRILFEELEVLFPDQQVTFNEATIYLNDPDENRRNYIFINSAFAFDKLETGVLLDRVRSGDQIFLSGRIEGPLADSLGLGFSYFYALFDSSLNGSETQVSIHSPVTGTDSAWTHKREITYSHISTFDSSRTRVLGSWDNERVNFVQIPLGDGVFYVHTNPDLLTNYYTREPDRAYYTFTVLSHLPVRPTVWDAYYKDGRRASGSPLYVILETPYLRQAWQISILLLILFMIIKARRRQKAIPVIEPFSNSTVQFTKTIASLYLEQGEITRIITKRIRFFREYVRSHLNLEITDWNPAFQKDLAQRSGVSEQLTEHLFTAIRDTERLSKPGEKDLKTISDLLDTFYNQTER